MKVQGINERVRGILFDMDGLLMNSEKLYWQANIVAAKEAHINVPDDLYLKLVGSSEDEMNHFYHRYFSSYEQRNRFIKRTNELVWQWTDEGKLKLLPGVQRALDCFQHLALSMAIVTSNTEEVVEHNLWVTGIRNYFDFHLNSADIYRNHIKPKPEPDIYLLAAERMGLPKRNLLAFEDSSSGVKSATSAGIKCVMIPNLLPANDQDKDSAVAVCSSFDEFLEKI
ncbi:HAD family phosphatase [Lactobacillus sp. ESL0228]|uniref:HAD family hydrolase n=1 Tax=Lactobacillus sp. ESL0228 TaxID=2069352 RepID=UPI000EFBA564|nr:HAD family phosphatase [Lactobacillus sp. ESL0228]RMC48682.1 HAD family phosphatase [Lactobacillus sp. ESL0228]